MSLTSCLAVNPDSIYFLPDLCDAISLSPSRINKAREELGISMPVLCVGRRKYVRGADVIDFIVQYDKAAQD